MTTAQLTAIAPEWVVANGIIRPVNPHTRPSASTWNIMKGSPTKSIQAHDNWQAEHGSFSFSTDLPDGTYSAEGLKVVWEFKNSGAWKRSRFKPEEYPGEFTKYSVAQKPQETRIKITHLI